MKRKKKEKEKKKREYSKRKFIKVEKEERICLID